MYHLAHTHSDREYRWVGDWSRKKAAFLGGKTALVDATTDREFGFREMDRRANRTARLLADQGVERDNRVVILSRNRPEYLDLFFATGKMGAILAPLSFRLAPGELAELYEQIDPDLMVVEDAFAELGAAVRERVAEPAPTLLLESRDGEADADWPRYHDRLPADDSQVRSVPESLQDTHLLIHTGGSTGLPKLVTVTHGQVFWNAVNTMTATAGTGTRRVGASIYPFFHIGGWQIVAGFHGGEKSVIFREVDAGELLATMEREEVNGFAAVPAVLRQMANHEDWAETDLSSLDWVNSGGGPARRSVMEKWWDRDVELTQAYGLTEFGPSDFDMPREWDREKADSIGKPTMHTDARIVDEDGTEVETGEVGELELAGPAAAGGYWQAPEETREAFGGGWVSTGDLARVDEDGYYYIEGRKKNMYASGGENVYPPAVEDAVADHPKVEEVIVVPVPDEEWGEVGKAVVEGDESLTLDELEEFLDGRIARFKIPHHLAFVEEMPMSGPQKVDRQAIKEEFGEGVN
jgi:fatty-acyl-CoA synthase